MSQEAQLAIAITAGLAAVAFVSYRLARAFRSAKGDCGKHDCKCG